MLIVLSAFAADWYVKGVDLICEPSFPSAFKLNKLPVWHNLHNTHQRGGKLLCECACAYSTFQWPGDALFLCTGKTTCGGGSTAHSIPTPLCCSFFLLPISSLRWCDIILPGHQISQSHTGAMLLTFWLFYLLNLEKFPLIEVKTASCHSHLPLIKDWNDAQ